MLFHIKLLFITTLMLMFIVIGIFVLIGHRQWLLWLFPLMFGFFSFLLLVTRHVDNDVIFHKHNEVDGPIGVVTVIFIVTAMMMISVA